MTQLDPLDQPDPFDPNHTGEEPLRVSTLIGYEQGQWVVYLEVAYPSEVRRHRIQAYRTERQAQVAADVYLRMAMRDRPFRSEGH